MKKLFISILFLPTFYFSQVIDTTYKITNSPLDLWKREQRLIYEYNEKHKRNEQEYIELENQKIYKCINCTDTIEKIEGNKITHILKIHYIGFDELELQFSELEKKFKRLQKHVQDMTFYYMKLEMKFKELENKKKK